MADILTKAHVRQVIDIIQQIYLSDNIPWICGYSGGKDSSAVVQLVWMALQQLPIGKRHKIVHIISTDTLVESPVVAAWAKRSLTKIQETAAREELPILPHRLTPQIQNTYWVNLIGRGYPYPRPNFRWCTTRMKIDPSNQFIKSVLAAESEAIHGPYKKEVREDFLRRLLRLQSLIRKTGPEELREANLITQEELRYIRKLWLDEKHEFDDALPRIYREETGEEFVDPAIQGNKYYGQAEWELLAQVCEEKYPGYELLLEMQSSLLDMEAKNSAINAKKNVLKKLEAEIRQAYYKDEADAEQLAAERRRRRGEEEPVPDDEEQLPEDME